MAKRAATKQLTQDNWDDDDDEKETAGTYKPGDPRVLENRVMKKAKRNLKMDGTSPFIQFGGFGSPAAKKPSFSFLKTNCEKLCPQNAVIENHDGKQNGSNSLKIKTPEEKKGVSSLSSEKSNKPYSSTKDKNSCSPSSKKYESRDVEYYRQLKALNESLMPWMEMHLSKNPWCDFTPVFDDYKKHLSVIEKKYPVKAKPSSHLPKPFSFKVPSAPVQKSCNTTVEEKLSSGEPAPKMTKLEPSTQDEDASESTEMLYGAGFKSNTTNTSTFSSGIKATTTETVPSSNSGPTSSCRSGEKDTPENTKSPTFTFSAAKSAEQSPIIAKQAGKQELKPFTFAISPAAKPQDSDSRPNNEGNDEDEYVPPKNEVTVVKEEDAVYSAKCKLFYKKEESYTEKGVGMLYLKSMGEKTQLLIRADTNLGNILLNIELGTSLPMQRMGKNNVLVVCVPNPPMTAENTDSKESVPLLIRVKTSSDADELLDMLNKYKS